MGLIIGLDIGGTTTKIVGLEQSEVKGFVQVQASDPLTSAYGGLGKFLEEVHSNLGKIEMIFATGVGASRLNGELFGKPARIVSEFNCVGLGGLFLTGLKSAIIVSMGTGTSIVAARQDGIEHVIGSGLGGGTILGLSEKLLNIRDFEIIDELSIKGNLNLIDLNIGDITNAEISGLTSDTTASNFGKLDELTQTEDIAAGIVNLVFQSVGTASVLAARMHGLNDIIITGNLSRMKLGKIVMDRFSTLYGKRFHLPERAEFATALGAGLHGLALNLD